MSVIEVPTVTLNSGYSMPVVGLGTWPMTDSDAPPSVAEAIRIGYRLIDTAASYHNERGVGQGIALTDVERGDLFVTTKLGGCEQGYESTLRAVELSCRRLGVEYLDLFLIHWPLPRLDRYVDSWRAMVKLVGDGLLRSIGVSNFRPAHIARLIDETGFTPAVNQIQLSPVLARKELRRFLDQLGIAVEGWSPLGLREDVPTNPLVVSLASKYERTAAQILLRWAFQNGAITVPRSTNPARQLANLDIFDFTLSVEDLESLDGIDRGEAAAVDSDVYEELLCPGFCDAGTGGCDADER